MYMRGNKGQIPNISILWRGGGLGALVFIVGAAFYLLNNHPLGITLMISGIAVGVLLSPIGRMLLHF